MNARITIATARRVLTQLRHDPRTLVLLLFVPSVLMALLWWVYDGGQVFDQIGKCHSILPAPHTGPVANVTFGGPNFDEMYVTNGDKVFKRKTKVKGVMSWRAALKPPAPRL